MSNKRNRRRAGQRVRSEVSRKPRHVTKSQESFIASQPSERARKAASARDRQFYSPSRKDIKKHSRRFRKIGLSTRRKPRTNYGRTYWSHSHDT